MLRLSRIPPTHYLPVFGWCPSGNVIKRHRIGRPERALTEQSARHPSDLQCECVFVMLTYICNSRQELVAAQTISFERVLRSHSVAPACCSPSSLDPRHVVGRSARRTRRRHPRAYMLNTYPTYSKPPWKEHVFVCIPLRPMRFPLTPTIVEANTKYKNDI